MTSPYLTFRDKDKNGDLQYYILQREQPHYVGIIKTAPSETAIVQHAVPGYHLWVVYSGVLRGNYIPSSKQQVFDLENIYMNMAMWFVTERIHDEEKRFKKFKIITDANRPTQ